MPPPSRSAWPWVAVAVAGCAAGAVLAWPYTVDDAFIVLRYADNLAHGAGYAFNPGVRSDGVTGPLWLLPMFLGMTVAKATGLLSTLAAIGWALIRSPLPGRPWGALFLAACPTLAVWSIAGLETGAATLALTLALLPPAAPTSIHHVLPTLLGLAALPWLRPETLPAAGTFWLVMLLGRRRDPGMDSPEFDVDQGEAKLGRRILGVSTPGSVAPAAASGPATSSPTTFGPVPLPTVALGTLVLSGLLLLAWRLWFFDVPWLPVRAKGGAIHHGLAYAARCVAAGLGFFGPVLLLLRTVLPPKSDPQNPPLPKALGAAIAVHLFAIAIAGGDWMPGYRLIAPILPVFALLFGHSASTFRWRSVGIAGAGLTLCVLALDAYVQLPAAREAGHLREENAPPLAEALRQHRRIAIVDIGVLGWLSGAEIIDLAGLTDATIAQAPGGHLDKELPMAMLDADPPDAIVLHSVVAPESEDGQLSRYHGYPVENRLASHPWTLRHYEVSAIYPYAPHYHYVVLVRRDTAR